jgi:hypothetical protein
MNYEWLAAHAFERAHIVIAAVNTLSIHTRLLIAKRTAAEEPSSVVKARTTLLEFLEILGHAVENAERDRDHIAFGVDPRLSQLAQQIALLRRRYPPSSALSKLSFQDARALLVSHDLKDASQLLTFLKDLRALVERLSHTDVVTILGDL